MEEYVPSSTRRCVGSKERVSGVERVTGEDGNRSVK